jgi:hypothetical protein
MSFLSKIFLILVTIFSFSINVSAATGPEKIPELKEKVYYNISPSRPNVGDSVEIEAEMYGTEIKNSNFVWSISKKTVKEGVGENRFVFTLSEKTKIDLSITTGAGVIIQRSFEFDPKRVVIIWESKTYTQPFYKGKSLYSKESSLVLNAINLEQENPLTNRLNNYIWKVDSTVKGKESGVGYVSYLHKGDILGLEPLFTVTLSPVGSKNQYQSILRVQAFPTEIISYEKNPLLGVLFNKTVKPTFNFNEKNEATIVAYPVNYSVSSSLSTIYNWYINDVKINTSLNEISFKKTKDNNQSRLSLDISNPTAILQNKTASYIIDTTRK